MKPSRWMFVALLPPVLAGAALLKRERPRPAPEPDPAVDVYESVALLAADSRRGLPELFREDSYTAAKRREITEAIVKHDFARVPALVQEFRTAAPDDLWARAVLSDAWIELGERQKAEDEIQAFLDIKPCGASYARGAYFLHLTGDTAAASEVMTLAWEGFNPADPDARSWVQSELGDFAWHRGDLDAADLHYRKGLAVKEGHRPSLAGRARVAAARGQIDEACSLLEAAADTPALYSELAFALRAAGRKEAAEFAIRRGIKLGSGSPLWARSLATLLADHGLEPDRAVSLASAEAATRPGVHSWDALAWALVSAKRFEEAWDAARRATAWGTGEPLLLYHAGVAAMGAGRTQEGVAWLKRARELNPAFHPEFARRAEELLR